MAHATARNNSLCLVPRQRLQISALKHFEFEHARTRRTLALSICYAVQLLNEKNHKVGRGKSANPVRA